MSTDTSDTLGGATVKDISLVIVMISIGLLLVVVSFGVVIGIANNPEGFIIGGEFNLSEWNAAFMLLVGSGISMVSGALATKQALASRKV